MRRRALAGDSGKRPGTTRAPTSGRHDKKPEATLIEQGLGNLSLSEDSMDDDAVDEEALGTAAVSPGHDASARQVLARAVAGALDIIGTDADAVQKRRQLELHCYVSHFALEDVHLLSALYP